MGGETVQITMPQMGESVSEGTVLTWHKQEGDAVEKDETVVEISTDKVDAEVPAPASGKLIKIAVGEDEVVTVAPCWARSRSAPAPTEPVRTATDRRRTEARQPRRHRLRPLPLRHLSRKPQSNRRRPRLSCPTSAKISPVAKRVAAAHGIDLNAVEGSGTGGRIVKDDVLALIENGGKSATADGASGDGAAVATAPDALELQPIRGSDAVLARYMTQSLTIPTATSFRTFAVSAMDARRRQLNQALKEAGRDMKVSFTHLIGYAIIRALESIRPWPTPSVRSTASPTASCRST